MKIQKKNWGGRGGGVEVGGGCSGWGKGGCERRIEVFVKIQKKLLGRVRSGGSFCENSKKKFREGVRSRGWGSGWGVRVDVNKEFKFL